MQAAPVGARPSKAHSAWLVCRIRPSGETIAMPMDAWVNAEWKLLLILLGLAFGRRNSCLLRFVLDRLLAEVHAQQRERHSGHRDRHLPVRRVSVLLCVQRQQAGKHRRDHVDGADPAAFGKPVGDRERSVSLERDHLHQRHASGWGSKRAPPSSARPVLQRPVCRCDAWPSAWRGSDSGDRHRNGVRRAAVPTRDAAGAARRRAGRTDQAFERRSQYRRRNAVHREQQEDEARRRPRSNLAARDLDRKRCCHAQPLKASATT